jgi:AraC-like DNA-binding protein
MKLNIEIDVPDPSLDAIFRALIDKSGEVTLSDAAALAHLSESGLSREFKRLTGQTFRQARLIVKLEIGAQMLLHTDLRISEVAYALRYSEPRKFKKVFKQHYGLSPTAYRKALQAQRYIPTRTWQVLAPQVGVKNAAGV